MVRKATEADIPAVTAIYDALLDREEQGLLSTGWTRGVYPTEQTARDALRAGTLYVMEREGRVTAAAKIDQSQMEQYSRCRWQHDAPPEQVLVLHTLVVDPAVKGRGCGTAFVRFYEAGLYRGRHRGGHVQRHPRRGAGMPGKESVKRRCRKWH